VKAPMGIGIVRDDPLPVRGSPIQSLRMQTPGPPLHWMPPGAAHTLSHSTTNGYVAVTHKPLRTYAKHMHARTCTRDLTHQPACGTGLVAHTVHHQHRPRSPACNAARTLCMRSACRPINWRRCSRTSPGTGCWPTSASPAVWPPRPTGFCSCPTSTAVRRRPLCRGCSSSSSSSIRGIHDIWGFSCNH